jgi:hypothetical protein
MYGIALPSNGADEPGILDERGRLAPYYGGFRGSAVLADTRNLELNALIEVGLLGGIPYIFFGYGTATQFNLDEWPQSARKALRSFVSHARQSLG